MAQQTDVNEPFWVNRQHPSPPRSAPAASVGAVGWMRANLFSSMGNTILTLAAAVFLGWAAINLARWVFTEAFWMPIWVNRKLFAVGTYPWEYVWRPGLALLTVDLLLGLSAGRWGSFMRTVAFGVAALQFVFVVLPIDPQARLILGIGVALVLGGYLLRFVRRVSSTLLAVLWILSIPWTLILLRGGIVLPRLGIEWTFAGEMVPSSMWGGLMLTILLAVVGITFSFPFGVLLALGRRSSLPLVRVACTAYIELIRGVPMVTLLFMAAIALPLFLPAGAPAPENVMRAMVAIVLFEAAYLAENVRGGLQSVPKGQSEAADALGLSGFQKLRLIILPQALRAVIPAIVGQFISLFKDTSLVVLVGLFEFLGIARAVIGQPEWIGVPGGITREIYLFAFVVYFIFSFGMSSASRKLEAQLGVGRR